MTAHFLASAKNFTSMKRVVAPTKEFNRENPYTWKPLQINARAMSRSRQVQPARDGNVHA